MAGTIRVGIGGWTFEPWRGVFYPSDLKQKDELAYASRHLTAIEINGTYYSTFKPDSWKKWRDETPDEFVFAVKGSRFTTNRRELASAGESLERFFAQGMSELGERLGPVFWQLPHTKKFDEADLDGFFSLLPRNSGRPPAAPRPGAPSRQLLHAGLSGALAQARDRQRLRQTRPLSGDRRPHRRLRLRPAADRRGRHPHRLSARGAGRLGRTLRGLGRGRPRRRACRSSILATSPPRTPRDVFAFIIHEGKVRAPAAAMALIERCS